MCLSNVIAKVLLGNLMCEAGTAVRQAGSPIGSWYAVLSLALNHGYGGLWLFGNVFTV